MSDCKPNRVGILVCDLCGRDIVGKWMAIPGPCNGATPQEDYWEHFHADSGYRPDYTCAELIALMIAKNRVDSEEMSAIQSRWDFAE